jgi:peptidoglycan hydrolase-like protein with peptidoglycan-binding domain
LVLFAVAGSASAAPRARFAALQAALHHEGFYGGPVDGVPGPATVAAVRAFQRREGLVVDGVAGPQTRAALGRLGRPRLGKRLVYRGLRGWDVAALQFLLTSRGFPAAPVDGDFGPHTHDALLAFQQEHGLAADGIAGPHTVRALGREAAPPPAQTTVLPRAEVAAAIDRWALHYGIRPELARALAWQESGFQPSVVSSAGAEGVMQVTPSTWAFVEEVLLGRLVPHTADGNIRVGVAFLAHLMRSFGSERRAVAAYYQGARSVRRRGVLPETALYVANVLALVGRV